jgi:hypothetical protein
MAYEAWSKAKSVAVIVGINYVNQSSELAGCRNDAVNVYNVLVNNNLVAKENVAFLVEGRSHKSFGTKLLPVARPTKANILKALNWAVEVCKANPSIKHVLFHYSGHGTYVRHGEEFAEDAPNGVDPDNEDDRRHEMLVPVDCDLEGCIVDDDLNRIFAKFPNLLKIRALVDACHSETVFDAKYRCELSGRGFRVNIENPECQIGADLILLTGCKDTQTSADAPVGQNDSYEGAMTNAFIKVVQQTKLDVSCYDLLKAMRADLKANNFDQIPQLCSTTKLTVSTSFLGGVERSKAKKRKAQQLLDDQDQASQASPEKQEAKETQTKKARSQRQAK